MRSTALLFLFATQGIAGWIPAGPTGGAVVTLSESRANPRTLYAGNAGGVFRSDDGGLTWSDVSRGLRHVDIVAADPLRSGIAYVATDNGVYKTKDSGQTWSSRNRPLSPLAMPTALRIDPSNPDIVYVSNSCYDEFSKATNASSLTPAISKSTDGGETWTDVGPDRCIDEFSLDPAVPSHLFARGESGAWQSFDGAATWARPSSDIPPESVIDHPQLALTRYGITNGASTPLTLQATILVSPDGGLTWQPAAGNGLPQRYLVQLKDLAIDPEHVRLFLATSYGTFRSGDSGANWLRVGGAADLPTSDVLFDEADARVVIATAQGIFHAPSPAFTPWTSGQLNDLSMTINQIAVDPRDAQIVYARSIDAAVYPTPPGETYGRIFRSRDGGRSWTVVSPQFAPDLGTISIDAAGNVYASNGSYVVKLPADADEWQTFLNGSYIIVPSRQNANLIYAFGPTGVSVTRDGGATWTIVSPTLVITATIDPTDSARLYAGGNEVFLRSGDGGTTWARISLQTAMGYDTVQMIAVAPSKPNVIYRLSRHRIGASDTHSALFRSDDYGTTWSDILHHPAENATDAAIAIDPHDENDVFITSSATGVIRSTDGGRSWAAINDDLPTKAVSTVTIAPNDSVVRIGTYDASAWEMPLIPRARAVRAK